MYIKYTKEKVVSSQGSVRGRTRHKRDAPPFSEKIGFDFCEGENTENLGKNLRSTREKKEATQLKELVYSTHDHSGGMRRISSTTYKFIASTNMKIGKQILLTERWQVAYLKRSFGAQYLLNRQHLLGPQSFSEEQRWKKTLET